MALQKTYTNDQGVSANYWRVESILFYLDTPRVSLQLELYVDAAARTADKLPLESIEYNVDGADFTTYFETAVLDQGNKNPQSQSYIYLKTLTTPIDFTTGTTDV